MSERERVEAALERAKRSRPDALDWTTVDAWTVMTHDELVTAFAVAFDDRAVLAAEVRRLWGELWLAGHARTIHYVEDAPDGL